MYGRVNIFIILNGFIGGGGRKSSGKISTPIFLLLGYVLFVAFNEFILLLYLIISCELLLGYILALDIFF